MRLPPSWPPLQKGAREMAAEHYLALIAAGTLEESAALSVSTMQGAMAALLSDLRRPASRDYWFRWLEEEGRGHALRWAEAEPEALAWSLFSVSKGGPPLADILYPWCETTGNKSWIRQRVFDPKNEGGGLWVCETVGVETAFGWGSSLSRDPVTRWWWQGQAVGAEGRVAADQAALEVPVGLREPDGTLRLPPLPPLPVGLEGSRADPG